MTWLWYDTISSKNSSSNWFPYYIDYETIIRRRNYNLERDYHFYVTKSYLNTEMVKEKDYGSECEWEENGERADN